MKSSLVFFFVLFLGVAVSAQDSLRVKNKRSFFLGFGGPGFGGSFNYQQKIGNINKTNGLFFRVGSGGLGPIPGRDGGSFCFTFPIGMHYNFTKSSKWEIGGGATPFVLTNDRPSMAGFAHLAFYPSRHHTFRLVFSPFFLDKSTNKKYFGKNSFVFFHGGVDLLFPLRKLK